MNGFFQNEKDLGWLDSWLAVIPARLDSTRLPEKPLSDLGGKPLIVRVYENISKIEGLKTVVATDSEKIISACKSFDISAELTSCDHKSGSDRVFEISSQSDKAFIVNVQGDEPFIDVDSLGSFMKAFMKRSEDIGTLGVKVSDGSLLENPNRVKVVTTSDQRALYFSRSKIPHGCDVGMIHVGVYAYKKDALKHFCELPPSSLETQESLEQLRALENNMSIYVHPIDEIPCGIDTAKDLENARRRI